MSKTIYIGGRLESKEKGNVVTGANAILDDTKGKKQNVINKETDDELLRLEQSKQDNLTFDNAPTEDSTNPVTSGGVYTAEKALSDAIEAILLLIPSAATALNKLVDTNTMNSSISTATATFRGTYNAVSDLGLTYQATHAQIEAALDALGLTADNNDYAFVQVPVSDQSQDIAKTERYKNNGTNWQYEYDLNTSGFTAAQWGAINSTITLTLVQKLAALPTNAELLQALGLKQDVLTFDNAPTTDSNNPVKSGGIKNAIDTAVGDEATARENADTALGGLIGDEQTRAEGVEGGLNTRLGAVEGSVSTIQGVIPSGAASNNKLVDNDSMTTYIGTIIDNIDATFNVTSTDGHVTLAITQVNGVITSVQLTTSDIASAAALNLKASQADLTALAGRVTTAEGNIISLIGRVSTNETDIANLQQLYNNLQQSKPVPVTSLPSSGQQQGVIYRLAGTTSYSDYMWNGSTWVLMATYNNAIDDFPMEGSDNLVKSGGVADTYKDFILKYKVSNVIEPITDASTIAGDGTYTALGGVRQLNGFSDTSHKYLFLVKYTNSITDIARITTTGYSFDYTIPGFNGMVLHAADSINYAVLTGYGSNASINFKSASSSEYPQTFAKVALWDVTGLEVTDWLVNELAKHFGATEVEIEKSIIKDIPSYNLIAKSQFLENTRIHNSGSVQTGVTGYTSTDFIDLGTDCENKVVYNKYSCDIILFYDSLQSMLTNNQSHFQYFTIPSGCRYVRYCWSTTELGDGNISGIDQDTLIATNMVCVGESVGNNLPYKESTERLVSFDNIENWRKIFSNSLGNGYYGKIIDTFGDSITQARVYQGMVSRYFGCSVDVHGVGGSRVSGDGSGTSLWEDDRINTLNPEADYIVIMGGLNDATDYTLGTLSDENFDTDTFIGAYNTVIHKIWHRYRMLINASYTGVTQVASQRDVHIVLMTPIFRTGREAALKELSEAVIAIGKMWNIPVVDLYFQSNMGIQTLDIYWGQEDKTHPNYDGYKQIASLLIGKMKEIEPIY